MAEGKERYAEYKTDKADGSVNWAQEGKDAMKDWKPQVGVGSLRLTPGKRAVLLHMQLIVILLTGWNSASSPQVTDEPASSMAL